MAMFRSFLFLSDHLFGSRVIRLKASKRFVFLDPAAKSVELFWNAR